MRRLIAFSLLLGIAACVCAAGKSSVVTFSPSDLVRVLSEGCGPTTSPRAVIHPHRNPEGTMLSLVSEDHRELVILPDAQQCNQLSSPVVDVWRDNEGVAIAQLIERNGERLLMVDKSELRGKHFDIERSGRYLLIFNGTDTIVNAVERPYVTLLKLPFHGRRLFARKRALLVVGDNPVTKMLEARVVAVGQGTLSEQSTLAIANMPAGVRVLDYSESTDELLLGGVNAAGEPAFVVYNLTSGASSSVSPQKPGDTQAMFLASGKLRARLGAGTDGAREEKASAPKGQKEKKGGFFGKLLGK